jgi:hypothetical protein
MFQAYDHRAFIAAGLLLFQCIVILTAKVKEHHD